MKSQIHICHFTTVHPRDDGRIFFKQCVYAAKSGYRVTLIVADGLGDKELHGVSILDIGKASGNRFSRMRKRARKMWKLLQSVDADIYQFHDPELLKIGERLKSKGKKVVYDSHEDVPNQILYKTWLGPLLLRKLLSRLYNAYEKRQVKKLDGLISVIDEITVKFACKSKATIKNYPILEHLIQARQPIEERLNQIVYVGSITKPRGVIECIQAMKYVPEDYSLILIGRFIPESFLNECQQLPEWNRVKYLGFKNLEELAVILGESKIGLSVLHAEKNYLTSLPTKGFEYMAAGLPLVMSSFEYWKNYFNDCAIMIEPGNAHRIGQAICQLIESEDEYNLLKSNAEKQCINYGWEGQFELLNEFYQRVIQS